MRNLATIILLGFAALAILGTVTLTDLPRRAY